MPCGHVSRRPTGRHLPEGRSAVLGRLARPVRQPLWALDRIGKLVLPNEAYARIRFGSSGSCRARLRRAIEPVRPPIFVFPPPSVAWGYLFQRPQQMAVALAQLGMSVVYAADSSFSGLPDRRIRGAGRLADGLTLFADGRGCSSVTSLGVPLVCWQYWPHQSGFRRRLPPDSALIYDRLDDLSIFESYPGLVEDDRQTLAEADLVLATSSRLEKEVRRQRPDVLLVPNAVAYDDFASPAVARDPALEGLRARSGTLVGYFGALADWIDWDLLVEVARARPDWTLLMVGDRIACDGPSERLAREPNVVLWPRRAYRALGQLLLAFDVAILPFRINDATRAVSPIKAFEYMAGGKPVVSTPLPEVLKYPEIKVADTVAGFIREIEWALGAGQEEGHRRALQARARRNTWRRRAGAVIERLQSMNVIERSGHG